MVMMAMLYFYGYDGPLIALLLWCLIYFASLSMLYLLDSSVLSMTPSVLK